jgi:hypothetical protein
MGNGRNHAHVPIPGNTANVCRFIKYISMFICKLFTVKMAHSTEFELYVWVEKESQTSNIFEHEN